MDIGIEEAPIIVEPLKTPVPTKEPAPVKQPVREPERPQREKAPA